MIRALVQRKDGSRVVLLGLEPQNMARLRDGQPIHVNLRHLVPNDEPIEELPDLDVAIFYAGADELAALKTYLGQP